MKIALCFFTIVSLLLIAGCSSSKPDFAQITRSDPGWLIAREDSLLKATPDDENLNQALLTAHFGQGQAAYDARDWTIAIFHYQRILEWSPRHIQGRFGLAMAEGQLYFKKGGPNDLWEAIVKFGEAAVIDTAHGVPHYWLGKSYEKKDKNDFDLIMEAYDQALKKQLPPEMKKAAEDARAVVLHRKEIYKAFWK